MKIVTDGSASDFQVVRSIMDNFYRTLRQAQAPLDDGSRAISDRELLMCQASYAMGQQGAIDDMIRSEVSKPEYKDQLLQRIRVWGIVNEATSACGRDDGLASCDDRIAMMKTYVGALEIGLEQSDA